MVTTASLPPENTHTRQTKSSFEMALNNIKYNDFKVMIVFWLCELLAPANTLLLELYSRDSAMYNVLLVSELIGITDEDAVHYILSVKTYL